MVSVDVKHHVYFFWPPRATVISPDCIVFPDSYLPYFFLSDVFCTVESRKPSLTKEDFKLKIIIKTAFKTKSYIQSFSFWYLLPVEEGSPFLDIMFWRACSFNICVHVCMLSNVVINFNLAIIVIYFNTSFFLFIFLNSFVHLHVTLMVHFLLWPIKCHLILILCWLMTVHCRGILQSCSWPTNTHTHPQILTRKHILTQHTHNHIYSHANTYSHTQTHILTRKHTHTHTQNPFDQ